jgi:hypothetical protein
MSKKHPSDNDLLSTFDAHTWAEKFVTIVRQNPEVATDVETMITWFANAIMVGYDEGVKRSRIVTLISSESESGYRLDGWANREQARIIQWQSSTEIIVQLLDKELASAYQQPAAQELGFPRGYLVVTSENIQWA